MSIRIKFQHFQMAEKGMDLVLISRNTQKLSQVAEEIGELQSHYLNLLTAKSLLKSVFYVETLINSVSIQYVITYVLF